MQEVKITEADVEEKIGETIENLRQIGADKQVGVSFPNFFYFCASW